MSLLSDRPLVDAASRGDLGERWQKWATTGALVSTLVVLGFGLRGGHAGGKFV
jgi:hypothetical protein